MTDTGSRNERRYFRLKYPENACPRLRTEFGEYHISELSEFGLRLVDIPLLDGDPTLKASSYRSDELAIGNVVEGYVAFDDGYCEFVKGAVLREIGDETVVQLTDGISGNRVLSEQRRLLEVNEALYRSLNKPRNFVRASESQ